MSHPDPRQDYNDDQLRYDAEMGEWESLHREYDEWLANASEQLEFSQWLKDCK